MALKIKKPATYQGPGWQARKTSHQQEIKDALFWAVSGYRSECAKLMEVMLCDWDAPALRQKFPDRIQHLRQVDWKRLRKEARQLKKVFEQNGVKVHLLRAGDFSDPLPNLMFVRDHFFMTPWGAILGRMASTVRAGEEKWAQLAIARTGIPLLHIIHGQGTFEGADALWIRPDCLLIGTGNRTNKNGFQQIQKLMADYQVKCVEVPLPRQTQHLLGLLQIVDTGKALLRSSIAPPRIKTLLKKYSYKIINIEECEEVTDRQALNIVALAPGKVIMPSHCPQIKARLVKEKIKVVAEVPISQLLNAAGGIACATGIIRRKD